MNEQFDPSLLTKDWEFQDLLAQCAVSTKKLAEVFMPHIFYSPWNSLHLRMWDFLDNCEARKKILAAPRGLGKTTDLRAYAIRKILYRMRHCIVYIGKQEGHAMAQTENIKLELMSNKEIRSLFGSVKIADEDLTGVGEMFSKKAWSAYGDIFVNPRGAEQQIRGILYKHYRPDLIICDDLEDMKLLDNEMLRRRQREWWHGDVVKSVPQFSPNWEIVYTDTVKHHDSLMVNLMDEEDYEVLTLSACTMDYKAITPDYMNQEEIDKEVRLARKNGTLDVFARERMSIPLNPENKGFKRDKFLYYKESDSWFLERRDYIRNVLLIDPAKTKNPKNAQTGFVVWGIDVETNKMFLRYASGELMYPDEQYAFAFELCKRYNIPLIAVETAGLEAFIKFPFQNAASKAGLNFEWFWLKAKQGKDELSGREGGKAARVGSLLPYYRDGLVYHNEANCGLYELQLLDFPRPKKWDIIDAGSYITQVMEENMMYFNPAMSASEGYDVEIEYAELDKLDRVEEEFDPYIEDENIIPSLGYY